jgi:hypothetical protein
VAFGLLRTPCAWLLERATRAPAAGRVVAAPFRPPSKSDGGDQTARYGRRKVLGAAPLGVLSQWLLQSGVHKVGVVIKRRATSAPVLPLAGEQCSVHLIVQPLR